MQNWWITGQGFSQPPILLSTGQAIIGGYLSYLSVPEINLSLFCERIIFVLLDGQFFIQLLGKAQCWDIAVTQPTISE